MRIFIQSLTARGPGLCLMVQYKRPPEPAGIFNPRLQSGRKDQKGQMGNPTNECRVLVVDDNRDTVETLAMLLKLSGHQVAIATEGTQAVQNAVLFQPDVVLLDLGLPRMHGHEVCRQIRERVAPHRPLMVAITGHGQKDVQRQSFEAGFDAHLLKPVDYDQLALLIDGHCDSRGATPTQPGTCRA